MDFKKLIKKFENKHAYLNGAELGYKGIEPAPNPHEKNTKEYTEWLDGYLDGLFIRKMTYDT